MAPDVRTGKPEQASQAPCTSTTTTHQAQSHGGLMLDARRATLQLPLMREVTALQKNLRTLQDPGTSSGSVTTSTSCSSGGHVHSKNRKKGKTQTFIGDPHQDAQALARELSGKLAKSALNGAPATRQHNLRIDKLQTKRRKSKTMTAEEAASAASPEMELGIRERIQRIESALDRSRPATVSGELRKEGLIRELKARRGQKLDMAQKEQPSLSQLLQGKNHVDAGSTATAPNLLRMVRDEEHRNGESLFESTDEQELSPMEREMLRPTPLTLRGEEELKKPRSTSQKKKKQKKPGSLRERSSIKAAVPIILNDDDDVNDDELAVLELPNGVQWDWSRIPKYEDRAFRDLTGAHPESSPKHVGHEMPELHPPVQSISSLDSDANALPLIIGEDAHDSDLAGFYASAAPRKSSGKRKASLQNAVKDVPGTSSNVAPPHRTLTQKYRPKNFKEIVGQSVVVKSLSAAILKSKVAPVYLFMGPRGTGKTSAARVFAAGLNCLSLDLAARPCGICRECGTLALNRSADVRQIDAAASADLASMRAMMGSFTPHAHFKIFIVEGSDLLTSEIWNSFLKLLEEPPANVVFILITTEADRIPATATSRCQKFQFLKLKEADIVKRLEFVAGREGLVVEADAFALIAMKADGSLRDAEIMLDQLCLLHKTISAAAVQELVGLMPDHKVLDLLDHALSANTVNIVRTMREVLAAGVEPLVLVSQLGALITDILVGSVDVGRENSSGFFSRKFSEKEEVHRLRQALKILSEAEKQLRVAADGATWLTAALLQFAPDRSFLPSEINNSTSSSGTPSPGRAELNDPAIEAGLATVVGLATVKEDEADATPEVENQTTGTTLSEQKLEEAWAGEPQAQDGGDPGAPAVEFQVFRDEALAELWKRVLWEVTPRNLKNMLQTQGRLIAAGVAVDGSCAVVELEFDYARDKHKAERSWRSICIAFQAVLSTAVELRIALSDAFPGESEVVRAAGDTPPSASQPPSARRPPRPRRGGTKARRHRHATEMLQRELGAQFSSDVSGVTPRRPPPPSRRRRVKKKRAVTGAVAGAVKPAGAAKAADHNSLTQEIWDALSVDMKPEEKKLLRSMMQEPQSDLDDLHAAQMKILKQRSLQFRNDPSGLTAVIDRRSSLIAELQRGLPAESSLVCWKRATPQSDFLMRKSRVKSVRKMQGKGLFLRLVPCAATNITPASMAPQLTAA